jgi:hypothetical protein
MTFEHGEVTAIIKDAGAKPVPTGGAKKSECGGLRRAIINFVAPDLIP